MVYEDIEEIVQNGDLTEFKNLFANLCEDEQISTYHLTIKYGKLEYGLISMAYD